MIALEKLDLSDNKRLEAVLDLFLIGCHTGLRYCDLSTLKAANIKDGFIKVTQIKTGGNVIIPVHNTVYRILAKYNGELPPAISNQKTNDYLKEITSKVDLLKVKTSKETTKGGVKVSVTKERWEMVSTHTCRRTFCTLQYLNGVPSITIMKISGHTTEKDFLKYIKMDSQEHAEKMRDMWAINNRSKIKVV